MRVVLAEGGYFGVALMIGGIAVLLGLYWQRLTDVVGALILSVLGVASVGAGLAIAGGPGNLSIPVASPHRARHEEERMLTMKANVGDRVVLESGRARPRIGVIVELRRADGRPPYLVRWLEDGREALLFPGPNARIEPRTAARVA